MTLPLIEKYRASKFEDIKGQDQVIIEVRNFLKMFPAKKALILNGPVGVGKTSLAIALANENNLELFELNASDLRNRISLNLILRPSIQQQSLFKKGKLILMDEADGITGTDMGGLPELIALITKTKFPIIITSNNIWERKFNLLRQKCKIVNLKELKENEIKGILINALHKEGKEIKLETLNIISKQSRGDVRAALNDLQSVIELGEEIYEVSDREKQESIFNIIKRLFQDKTSKDTIKIFETLKEDLDEILLWIEENIPLEYQGKALVRAFEVLSKADIFRGRIYRYQYWRFLVYESFFLSAGISSANKEKNNKFVSYKRPSRILKIWLANQKNAKMKSIVGKYAGFCHLSKKKAMKEKFLLPFIFDNLDEKTKRKLDFNDDEEKYLREKRQEIVSNHLINF